MKSVILVPVFALAAALPLAGCSSAPARIADGTEATPQCEQLTGTRIRVKDRRECEATGLGLKSYSADELRRTGEIDVVEALRQLDPTFQ